MLQIKQKIGVVRELGREPALMTAQPERGSSENLAADLKRSRLSNVIRPDERPAVMLMNIQV